MFLPPFYVKDKGVLENGQKIFDELHNHKTCNKKPEVVRRLQVIIDKGGWSLSKFKSSAEILDHFGYPRDEDFKLYCTVPAINRNCQGLSLRVDTEIEQLIENSNNNKLMISSFGH